MATKIGDLAVYISANTTALARDLTRAGGLVTSFGSSAARSMMSAGRSMVSSIAGAVADIGKIAAGNLLADGIKSAASGLTGMVQDSIKLAAAAEVSATQFEVLLGNAKDAGDAIRDLRNFASKSPVSTSDALKYGASLLSAGISKEQVTPTLDRLSDLSMGDPEKMASLVRVYGQVRSLGKLQGQDWMQIANTNTLNLQDLAKVLNVDVAELTKMREQGRITFTDLQKAIKATTDEGGRFFQMGEKYAGTLAGKLDKLGDSWEDAKRYFGSALVEELNLKGAADEVGDFTSSLRPFVDALRPALRFVGDLGRGLAQLAAEGGKAFFAIAEAVGGNLARRFPETMKAIREGVQGLKDFKMDPEGIARFAISLGNAIGDAIEWARPYWRAFVDDFVTPIRNALKEIVDWWDRPTNIHIRAAMSGGNYTALREGDKARAQAKKQEEATQANMKTYGLDYSSAASLVDWQESVRGFTQQQQQYQAERDYVRKVEDSLKAGGKLTPDQLAAYRSTQQAVAANDAEYRLISGARAKAEAEAAKIIARGTDPTKDPYSVEGIADRIRKRNDAGGAADTTWLARRQATANKQAFVPEKLAFEPRLAELAGKLNEKFVPSVDKFSKDLADLQAIREADKITADTFAFAVADLVKEAGGGLQQPQLAPALELASQELARAVQTAGIGQQPQTVEGLLASLKSVSDEQLRVAKQIASNTGAKAPVVTLRE